MSAHPPSEAIFHVGEVVAGRFEVTGRGTAGRLGAVYRAHDREIEVDVALKVIHPHLVPDEHQRREFVDKMARAQTLSHPNVARAYAAIVDRGRALLVMQYTPGVNLETLVGMRTSASAVSDPRYRWAEARPVLGQIAAGLAHVHGQGMIHGDVRPASVVVLPDGVKLTSVGVGMALPRDAFLGAVAGPGWERLAPELRGRAPVTARADVYSFGVLAIELLTASLPNQPLRVFGARGPFDAALERALEEQPERRFPTIEALLTELDRTAPGAAPRERPRHNTNPGPAPAPVRPHGSLREATERVDEEELRRLAGEVGELLDTTRRADADELEDLRLESRRPPEERPSDELDFGDAVPGGPSSEVTNPGRPSAISALPERVRTAPDLVRELAANTTPIVRLSPEEIQATVPIEKLPEEVVRPAELPAPPVEDEYETFRVPLVDIDPGPIEPLKRSATFSLEKDDDDPTVTISDRTPLPPPMPASTAPLVTPSPVSVSAIAAAARNAPAPPARAPQPAAPARAPQPAAPPARAPQSAAPARAATGRAAAPVAGNAAARPPSSASQLPPAIPTPTGLPPIPGASQPTATGLPPIPGPSATGLPPIGGASQPIATGLPPIPGPSQPTATGLPSGSRLPPAMATPTALPPPPVAGAGSTTPPPARRSTPPAIPALPAPSRSVTPPSVPAAPPPIPGSSRSTPPIPSMPKAAPAAPTLMADAPPPPAPPATGILDPPSFTPLPLPPPPSSQPFSFLPDPPPVAARLPPVRVGPPGRPVLLMVLVGGGVLALACVAALVIWMFHFSPRLPSPRPLAPIAVSTAPANPPSVPPAAPSVPPAAPRAHLPSPAPLVPPPAAPRPVAAANDGPCPAGADLVRGSTSYCIDRYEYPGRGQLPRTAIARGEAAALCAERGERLCSEKEWERACRGSGGTSYPYGPAYQSARCNTQGGPVREAGSFIDCKSSSGAFDMSGNVAEWTDGNLIKGGAAGEGDPAGRCSHHVKSHGAAAASVGFRCCARPR